MLAGSSREKQVRHLFTCKPPVVDSGKVAMIKINDNFLEGISKMLCGPLSLNHTRRKIAGA